MPMRRLLAFANDWVDDKRHLRSLLDESKPIAEAMAPDSAIAGISVVKTEPVSSTSRAVSRPLGPTTVASMMIRSPSISNELSDLISHHDSREVRKRRLDLAGEVVTDLFVATPPRACLLECLARCWAMTHDARGAKLEAMRVDSIHLDQAHPLVGIPLADLGPGHGFRDRRCKRCGNIHHAILCRMVSVSSFGDPPVDAGVHPVLPEQSGHGCRGRARPPPADQRCRRASGGAWLPLPARPRRCSPHGHPVRGR